MISQPLRHSRGMASEKGRGRVVVVGVGGGGAGCGVRWHVP